MESTQAAVHPQIPSPLGAWCVWPHEGRDIRGRGDALALGAAVEIARGKHIIVDTFVNLLPAAVRHWLDVVNLAIIATLNAFLLNYSIDWIAAVGGSENPVVHIPEGVVQIAMPIGCALTILFCATRIVSSLAGKSAAEQ